MIVNLYKNLKSLNFKVKFLFLTFLIISFFVLFQDYEGHNDNYKLIVLTIFFLNFLPFIYLFLNNNEQTILPIYYLTLIYFFCSYTCFYLFDLWNFFGETISGAIEKNGETNYADIYKSLKIFLTGLLALNLGFFSAAIILKKKRSGFKILRIKNDKEILVIAIFINLITLLLFYLFEIQNSLSSISQIKYPLIYLSIALDIFIIANMRINKLSKTIFFLPVIIIFYLEILSGSYAFPFTILIFVYVFYFYLTKKFLFVPLIFMTLFFLFFHTYKAEFRSITWNFDHSSNNLIYKSKSLVNSFKLANEKFLAKSNIDRLNFFKNRNLYRIFHSTESLIIVTKLTPDPIPYWKGASYKILLSKIIPRVFWSNKPSDRLGNEFGHRYNILYDGNLKNYPKKDSTTSWNMPVLNELYVNFGDVGTFLGMLIWGIILRLSTTYFSTKDHDNYEFIIGFTSLFSLFFLESHLSLVIGSIFQTIIFLFLLILILKFTLSILNQVLLNKKKIF